MKKNLVFFLAVMMFSCSGGGEEPTPDPVETPQVIVPVEGCQGGRIENANPNWRQNHPCMGRRI